MVAAAEALQGRRCGADQISPVRTDVGERAERALGVARQQQRFVDAAFQQREGQDGTARSGPLRAVDELPASREHALAHPFEENGVAVERGRQRARLADVGVDHCGHRLTTLRPTS